MRMPTMEDLFPNQSEEIFYKYYKILYNKLKFTTVQKIDDLYACEEFLSNNLHIFNFNFIYDVTLKETTVYFKSKESIGYSFNYYTYNDILIWIGCLDKYQQRFSEYGSRTDFYHNGKTTKYSFDTGYLKKHFEELYDEFFKIAKIEIEENNIENDFYYKIKSVKDIMKEIVDIDGYDSETKNNIIKLSENRIKYLKKLKILELEKL